MSEGTPKLIPSVGPGNNTGQPTKKDFDRPKPKPKKKSILPEKKSINLNYFDFLYKKTVK